MADSDDNSSPHRQHRWRNYFILLLLLFIAWLSGAVWFGMTIPHPKPEDSLNTDAIVVLTGGSGRLKAGFDLLEAGRAQALFISGVYRGVDVLDFLNQMQRSPEKITCCVILGYDAHDTASNADETARWMREQGYASLRLVTSNYHIRRSLLEFKHTLPDIDILPHPIRPSNIDLRSWWRDRHTFRLISIEFTKYVLSFLSIRSTSWIKQGIYQLEKIILDNTS